MKNCRVPVLYPAPRRPSFANRLPPNFKSIHGNRWWLLCLSCHPSSGAYVMSRDKATSCLWLSIVQVRGPPDQPHGGGKRGPKTSLIAGTSTARVTLQALGAGPLTLGLPPTRGPPCAGARPTAGLLKDAPCGICCQYEHRRNLETVRAGRGEPAPSNDTAPSGRRWSLAATPPWIPSRTCHDRKLR